MTIATVRYMGSQLFLSATLGSLVLVGCATGDGDDVVKDYVDDDVKNYTVDDGSLEPSGAHRAVLKTDDAPPVLESIFTDAILAIAIAEEGKGPDEVGVSTGFPLTDYADDLTGGWCSEFVSWAYWRGGCPFSDNWGNYPWMLGGSTQIRQWFLDYSRFIAQTDPEWATFVPQPGDYIRYNTSGGGHSGIVRYAEGTTLYTVEGNVNNIVMLRSLRNYKTDYSDPVDGIDGFGVNPCGDEGAGGAAGGGGAGGEPATGGAGGDTSTGGAGGSGGSEPLGSGGAGVGGAVIGSGGAGVGGSTVGSGGAGVGGSIVGSGGAGVGGYDPGAGGALIGTGGAALGSGGTGVGGATLGSGGAGLGGDAPGTGGAPVGAGGALVGLGGAATGGSTTGPLTAIGGQPAVAALGGASGEASNEGAFDESGCSCTVPGGTRRGDTRTPWSTLGLLGLLLVRRRRPCDGPHAVAPRALG